MSVGELLFEFAGKARGVSWVLFNEGGSRRVPLLDFVEARKEGHGDEDDDCFLAVADFELCGRSNVSYKPSLSVALSRASHQSPGSLSAWKADS